MTLMMSLGSLLKATSPAGGHSTKARLTLACSPGRQATGPTKQHIDRCHLNLSLYHEHISTHQTGLQLSYREESTLNFRLLCASQMHCQDIQVLVS